jgi:hypothetical protein
LICLIRLKRSNINIEEQGLSPHDLIPFIGGGNRVREVTRPKALTEIEDDLASA